MQASGVNKLPNRKSRSILEEIGSITPRKSKEELIEARAQHIIISAINLLESIDNSFNQEDAADLRNRFMSSIRGADPRRFSRMVKKIKFGSSECDDLEEESQ